MHSLMWNCACSFAFMRICLWRVSPLLPVWQFLTPYLYLWWSFLTVFNTRILLNCSKIRLTLANSLKGLYLRVVHVLVPYLHCVPIHADHFRMYSIFHSFGFHSFLYNLKLNQQTPETFLSCVIHHSIEQKVCIYLCQSNSGGIVMQFKCRLI